MPVFCMAAKSHLSTVFFASTQLSGSQLCCILSPLKMHGAAAGTPSSFRMSGSKLWPCSHYDLWIFGKFQCFSAMNTCICNHTLLASSTGDPFSSASLQFFYCCGYYELWYQSLISNFTAVSHTNSRNMLLLEPFPSLAVVHTCSVVSGAILV